MTDAYLDSPRLQHARQHGRELQHLVSEANEEMRHHLRYAETPDLDRIEELHRAIATLLHAQADNHSEMADARAEARKTLEPSAAEQDRAWTIEDRGRD